LRETKNVITSCYLKFFQAYQSIEYFTKVLNTIKTWLPEQAQKHIEKQLSPLTVKDLLSKVQEIKEDDDKSRM